MSTRSQGFMTDSHRFSTLASCILCSVHACALPIASRVVRLIALADSRVALTRARACACADNERGTAEFRLDVSACLRHERSGRARRREVHRSEHLQTTQPAIRVRVNEMFRRFLQTRPVP